jgi:Bacterial PH domain
MTSAAANLSDTRGILMIYESRKDWWPAWPVGSIGALLVCLGLGLIVIGTVRGELPMIAVGSAQLVPGSLIGWMLFSTSYEIDERSLRIELGPFRWSMPVDSIVEVEATRRFLHSPGWGLAWSLDRLRIRTRRSALPFWISPLDQAGFLRDLCRIRPDLEVKRF